MYKIRNFDPKLDQKAAHRIWREINWIESDEDEKLLDIFLKEGNALVAERDGSAECLVTSKPSILRYQKEDLDLSVITSVGTSRVARKQGLAKKMTARQIALDAEAGAVVSTLGIFEQGFYNQLGYGNGSYEHWISFDPADLKISQKINPPRRLANDDWKLIHGSLMNRQRRHGAVTLLPECVAEAELKWTKNGFGLGYMDDSDQELTHFFWGSIEGEYGPFTIRVMAYQNFNQFLELMAIIKSLGDQVRLVKMREPSGIQMQDLIKNPFRPRVATDRSKFEHRNRAAAYWQMRICNLEACVAATHLNSGAVQFNLELSDPIEAHLESDSKWQGCSGAYTLTLGSESNAVRGFKKGLPVLKADVGAFTRLWLGVSQATGLAATDNLAGPDGLLEKLDEVLCLPQPRPDWDY